MNTYFISYMIKYDMLMSFGNSEFVYNKEINSYKDIQYIQDEIWKDMDRDIQCPTEIIIINYTELEVD